MTVRFGAGNEAILSSAIWTLHLSSGKNIKEDTRMVVPSRGIFRGAMERETVAMNHHRIHFV
jgi:hypothetical protein